MTRSEGHCSANLKNTDSMFWNSLVAQLVKNPPANVEDARDVGSIPGWEDSLET